MITGSFEFFVSSKSASQASLDFTLAPHETRYWSDILGVMQMTRIFFDHE